METKACNERTPLIENSVITNGNVPLVRSHATFNRQAPLHENEVASNGQSSSSQGSISNLNTITQSSPSTISSDLEIEEVSLEEIVGALFLAWWRQGQSVKKATLNFFSTNELYALHLAWKRVTRGKYCFAENYKIAEELAEAIATESHPPYPDDESLSDSWKISFCAEMNLIAVNLLKEWERITEGVEFPLWYYQSLDVNSEVQPPDAIEPVLKRIEMYKKIYKFFFSDRSQICLHSLLFIWPIYILIVGFKYLDCPASSYLSCLLMILGIIGCLVSLFRLALIHVTSQTQNRSQWAWKWFGFRTVELTFLILFIIQAFHVFQIDPATEPDPDHCTGSFYKAALRINYISIALISAYVLVYFIKVLLYLNFDLTIRLLSRCLCFFNCIADIPL